MALTKLNARSASALDATILTGNLPAINGSALTNLVAGKIGQVIQVIFETDTDFAASSFQDITGGGNTLAASITPTATNSKVLVTYITQAQHGNNKGYKTQLERAISGGATTNVLTIPNQKDTYGDGDTNAGRSSVQYLDSPSTTSATTYTVMIGTDGAGTVTIANGGSQCMITLMEVLA